MFKLDLRPLTSPICIASHHILREWRNDYQNLILSHRVDFRRCVTPLGRLPVRQKEATSMLRLGIMSAHSLNDYPL